LATPLLSIAELGQIEVALQDHADDDANCAEEGDDQHVAEVPKNQREAQKQTGEESHCGHLHVVLLLIEGRDARAYRAGSSGAKDSQRGLCADVCRACRECESADP
jgi:hypothetical protein